MQTCRFCQRYHRVCTGHGKPGNSWDFEISFSRPGKSRVFIAGHGKSLKIVCGENSLRNQKMNNFINEKEPRNVFLLPQF